MEYKRAKDDETYTYDVFVDKYSLEEIKNTIIKRKLYKISDLYNILINIIDGIINEEAKSIDDLFEQIFIKRKFTVSFLKDEVEKREKQILLAENELDKNINIACAKILKTTIMRNKEQLDIYKIIDDSLKQEYYDFLSKVYDCVKLNLVNVKKKVKKSK